MHQVIIELNQTRWNSLEQQKIHATITDIRNQAIRMPEKVSFVITVRTDHDIGMQSITCAITHLAPVMQLLKTMCLVLQYMPSMKDMVRIHTLLEF